jgi:hypothetical protein
MERGMGYNIHMSYCSAGYWSQLLDRFAQDKPAALLLLDSFGDMVGRALEAKARLPQTLIIYRKFLGGDNQYTRLSPAQMIAENMALKGSGIYFAAENEAPWKASLPWLLEVAKAAKAAGLRVSLGGWSVGGYEIADIPAADALLRYSAANPGLCVWDFHEYCRGSWTVDFMPHEHNPANWPLSIPKNTALWLMGRFRHIITYCDTMGIKRPQIIVGEFGFDRVLAVPSTLYGNVGGLNTLEGLIRSWGFENWQAYAAVMLQAAFNAIYKPYGIPVCYYQLCDHPDNWREFNAFHAPTFMDATRKGFAMDIYPPIPSPAYTFYITGPHTLAGNGVRIRSAADTSAPIITTLNTGATVNVLSTRIEINDSFGWQEVESGGLRGFMALHGAGVTWSLTPVVTPPDRSAVLLECAAELEATAAKLRALAEAENA